MAARAGSTGPLILWGAGTSRAIRAHWALAELGLDYESRPIQPRSGETKTPEYTALTARQKIPLLQDGDFTITESAAIIAYLSDTYATEETALVPRSPKQRAQCLEWCFFILSELDAASLYVIRRHRDLADIYGAAPEVCDAAAAYFGQQMRSVERALSGCPCYLVGGRFTAADILLSTCISWAVRYEVPVDVRVLAYNARMTSRPAYLKASDRNTPLVS
ncbi:glutathione S-transferase family protein [Bradyrhizobium sp.]|uniref:glutathione S-transferase family protein n=1 Tax=Bradyrhizobium sp. TaxID=376 RepID=UPI003C72C92C